MSVSRRRVLLVPACALAWLLAPGAPARGADDPPSVEDYVEGARDAGESDEADGDEEDEGLRQRLTEREDRRRPAKPLSVELAGRPLTISGEAEAQLGALRHRVLGMPVEEPDRLLLEPQLELEAFYSFSPELALFAQIQLALEEDLLDDTFEDVSDSFVERGEMWLYSENIADTHVNVDFGRLDFEDERRFWWDDELDAIRVAYETERFEIALAAARELLPSRSDESDVAPEHERVIRWIAEVGWDFHPNHAIELFLLHQSDHSKRERPGQVVRRDREDESDARLTWLGARAMGVFELRTAGILGYWLDAAAVRGEERLVGYEDLAGRRSEVDEVVRRSVRGWAVDTGLSWILPFALEPRIFASYAFGSGDSTPDAGTDRSYRQTDLQGNEAGFGGVERFPHYGVVLEPELSNLHVATLGAGLSLLRSSSLDLVVHHYRLVEPATSLRDSRLEAELTGGDRGLGRAVDLVLAVEEWERLELFFVASGFRAGRAFGREHGTWSYGGTVAVRYAF